jgi:hypothetical protein
MIKERKYIPYIPESERLNNYQKASDDFCFNYIRTPKPMDWKAFKRFGYIKGQLLCEKYDVILTDHETWESKLRRASKKLTVTNLNKGIDKFNNGIDDFMKVIEPSKESKKLDKEINKFLGLK